MRWSLANTAFSEGFSTSPFWGEARVADIGTAYNRVVVVPPARAWRNEVMRKLENLMRLTPGWDGYRAQAVTLDTVTFTLQMLENTCGDKVPAPEIVPGISGDLQVEWHTDTIDIELHVRAANDVQAWHCSPSTHPDGEEMELDINFKPIIAWINELVEPTADADTAGA
eukprot:TRINITY_DN33632_c0_g1_i1.p1 TRINITY_DN33632_c0_g1~~TRINITY_DN33632_c0_g1_i1.p1  ORF type:complete len:169 (+),score=22.58 TRINITY_DN33632_c0_g1_i1:388-894(+)